jgi:hypothetical protein
MGAIGTRLSLRPLDLQRVKGTPSLGRIAPRECGRASSDSLKEFVMPGQQREARLRARCPGYPRLSGLRLEKTWMAGTSVQSGDIARP